MFYEVIPVKNGIKEALTYRYEGTLEVGQIVKIPLMRGVVAGVVIKKVAQPNFKCREILEILYSKPLPTHLLKTAQFIADYYLAPISSVVAMLLPNGILRKRRKQEEKIEKSQKKIDFSSLKAKIPLNDAQKIALEGLERHTGGTKLLFGVTGSGKTNIYLREALSALQRQKSTIILVPEIALTGQLESVFREIFSERVILIHSKLAEAERHLIFEKMLLSDEPRIIIGPRSALFAPMNNLGLIIIDEEHEQSYYQEKAPKYSAIRVASKMARDLKISCILGSATPNIVDYSLAEKQEALIKLEKRAKKEAKKPEVKIIDLKNRENFRKNRYFSDSLLYAISENLKGKKQTLIFHNRRGSAPITVCDNCGHQLVCPNCFLPLTLHADKYQLFCHTCGFKEAVPNCCPECKGIGLIHKGFGTKLLESEIRRLFPKARVRRFDADNKKGEGVEALYEEIKKGEVDILIGTQMIAKGLDLPKLATVGIVQADAGLSLPDFMAEEKTFQLLTQVIGRVGRGHIEKAEVIVQTFRPEHPAIQLGVAEKYEDFYQYLLRTRKKGGFMPFQFLARIEITMKTEKIVIEKIRKAYLGLKEVKGLTVSVPMPAFHERTKAGFTWGLIIKSRSREKIRDAISKLDSNFKVELDPPSLL